MTATIVTTALSRNGDGLTDLCHELKKNIERKEHMLFVNLTKLSADVCQWFDRQQKQDLTEHCTRIQQDIQSTKETAMVHLNQFDVELLAISQSVQKLLDNDIVELSHKVKLRAQLEKIRHRLDIYEVTAEINLSADISTYDAMFTFTSSAVVPQDPTMALHYPSQSSLLCQLKDKIDDLDDKINDLDLKQLEERLLQTITSWCGLQIQTDDELFSRRKEEIADILHRNESKFQTEKSELCKEIRQLKREITDLAKKGEATSDEVQLFKDRLKEIQSNFNTIQDHFVVIGKLPVQIGPHTISVIEANPKTLLSETHRKKINEFFRDSTAVDRHWQLIYKGQKDGFKSEDFHYCCDGKGPTITLVQTTTGLLFGGYTAVSWTSHGNHKADSQAFLFTLINPYQIPETKFGIKTDMVEYAVVHNKDFGPVFGDKDLVIVSSSDTDGPGPSCSHFPTAYSSLTETDSRLFGQGKPFIVNELEVYAELQFAAPGTYLKLDCNGRACVICKKCRDWCTKRATDWDRIRDIITSGSVSRWNDGYTWQCFERRGGATCKYNTYYDRRYQNLDFDAHCLCIDNRKVQEEEMNSAT